MSLLRANVDLHSFCRLFEHGQSQRADIDGAPEVTVSARNQPAPSKTVPSSCVMLQAEQARQFYSEHHGKNFFNKLVDFMTRYDCCNILIRRCVA